MRKTFFTLLLICLLPAFFASYVQTQGVLVGKEQIENAYLRLEESGVLTGTVTFQAAPIHAWATPNSFLLIPVGGLLTSTTAGSDGQILISRTGSSPLVGDIQVGGVLGQSSAPGSKTVFLDLLAGTGISVSGPVGRKTISVSSPEVIRKTADETVNNSTTLQNDDHLFRSIGANETLHFQAVIFYVSSTGADIQFAFTVPALATLQWGEHGSHVSTSDGFEDDTSAASGTAATGLGGVTSSNQMAILSGTVITSGTSGTVRLQWAQDNLEASDTEVLANSYLTIFK